MLGSSAFALQGDREWMDLGFPVKFWVFGCELGRRDEAAEVERKI